MCFYHVPVLSGGMSECWITHYRLIVLPNAYVHTLDRLPNSEVREEWSPGDFPAPHEQY